MVETASVVRARKFIGLKSKLRRGSTAMQAQGSPRRATTRALLRMKLVQRGKKTVAHRLRLAGRAGQVQEGGQQGETEQPGEHSMPTPAMTPSSAMPR